jgi:hypothetical protein
MVSILVAIAVCHHTLLLQKPGRYCFFFPVVQHGFTCPGIYLQVKGASLQKPFLEKLHKP